MSFTNGTENCNIRKTDVSVSLYITQVRLVPQTTKVAGGCDAGTAAVQDRYSREDVFPTALLGENGLKDAHQIQLEVPVPWHRSGSWPDEQAASTVRRWPLHLSWSDGRWMPLFGPDVQLEPSEAARR